MKYCSACLFVFFLTWVAMGAEGIEPETTLTKMGQPAPAFKVTTVDGKTVDLAELRGKVVLVNFFATWCGPCLKEFPHLEKEIWQRYKTNNFVVIAIGREHKNEELTDFVAKQKVSFKVAGDPTREIYDKFATKYIPRNVLIDAKGNVVFHEAGFTAESFGRLVGTIQKELGLVKEKEKK